MAVLQVEITTAERTVYSGEATLVLAPGIEGQLGILPNHAALMTILQAGELVLRTGSEEIYMAVAGGFLEVSVNHVTILADACERAEEIDEERAAEARRRAQERLESRGTAGVDLERAVASLRRAEVRLRAARRRRGLARMGDRSGGSDE